MDVFKRIGAILAILAFAFGLWNCQNEGNNYKQEDQANLETSKEDWKTKAIHIHNTTDQDIPYSIKPENPKKYFSDRILKSKEVDWLPYDEIITITFRKNGDAMKRHLVSGMGYWFDYDKDRGLILKQGWVDDDPAEYLAPFVATPMEIVDKMLEMAQIDQSDILYDLGSGDGRIVITAAKKYRSRGVGIDYNSKLIKESIEAAMASKVEDLVEFRLEDVTKSDFSQATIVTIYLLSLSNIKLRPLLEKQLKPGTLVVTHNFKIAGWEERELDHQSFTLKDKSNHSIYLYRR